MMMVVVVATAAAAAVVAVVAVVADVAEGCRARTPCWPQQMPPPSSAPEISPRNPHHRNRDWSRHRNHDWPRHLRRH